MKYTPRELSGNVNVSPRSPIKEFFLLLGVILAVVIGVYVVLGMAVDRVVTRLPHGTEEHLGSLYSKLYEDSEKGTAGAELQGLLDDLLQRAPPEDRSPCRVHLAQSSDVNAMALPGRNIVVFNGLLEQAETDNELAFVLAHELGHFANRDHLRGLGRALVLVFLAASIFGNDNAATEVAMNSLLSVEMKFSQSQERMADLYALDLVNRKYGHVAGVDDFFRKMAASEEKGRFSYYFATHPYPLDRIEALQEEISKKGYQRKDKIPLSQDAGKQESQEGKD